jgi:uncharacterized protein (TIGR02246 family)
MNRIPFLLFAALLFAPYVPAFAAEPAIEARYGFAQQMAAWNKGDLEAALDAYWNSPDMVWVNRRGKTQGFSEFASAMRSDFAGKPQAMGRYSGQVLDARSLANDAALLVVRWSIDKDGKRMMGGVSTQLWKRIGGQWRIVLEHAS